MQNSVKEVGQIDKELAQAVLQLLASGTFASVPAGTLINVADALRQIQFEEVKQDDENAPQKKDKESGKAKEKAK